MPSVGGSRALCPPFEVVQMSWLCLVWFGDGFGMLIIYVSLLMYNRGYLLIIERKFVSSMKILGNSLYDHRFVDTPKFV